MRHHSESLNALCLLHRDPFLHEKYNTNVEESLEALLLPWALFSFTPYIFRANSDSVASRLLERLPSDRVIMVIDINGALYGCRVGIFSGLQAGEKKKKKAMYLSPLSHAVLLI